MEDDPEVVCGDSRIWGRRVNEVFLEACTFHDYHYNRKHENDDADNVTTYTRKEVDREFLNLMLRVAETKALKARAYLYYGLVRALGGIWWK